MNAHPNLPVEYELVTGWSYVLTDDERNKLGLVVTAPLGVALCQGCDEPVPPNGVCDGCEVIHADGGISLSDQFTATMAMVAQWDAAAAALASRDCSRFDREMAKFREMSDAINREREGESSPEGQ